MFKIYYYLNYLINPNSDLDKFDSKDYIDNFKIYNSEKKNDIINLIKKLSILNLISRKKDIFLENEKILKNWLINSNNMEMIFHEIEDYYILYNQIFKYPIFEKENNLEIYYFKDFVFDGISLISPLTIKNNLKENIGNNFEYLLYLNLEKNTLEQFYYFYTFKLFFKDVHSFEKIEDLKNIFKLNHNN